MDKQGFLHLLGSNSDSPYLQNINDKLAVRFVAIPFCNSISIGSIILQLTMLPRPPLGAGISDYPG